MYIYMVIYNYKHTQMCTRFFFLLLCILCPMTLLNSSSSCSSVFLRFFHIKKKPKNMFSSNKDSFTFSFPIFMFSCIIAPFITINKKLNINVVAWFHDLFPILRWVGIHHFTIGNDVSCSFYIVAFVRLSFFILLVFWEFLIINDICCTFLQLMRS